MMMVTRDPYKPPTVSKLPQTAMERKRTTTINRINSAKVQHPSAVIGAAYNRTSQHAHLAAQMRTSAVVAISTGGSLASHLLNNGPDLLKNQALKNAPFVNANKISHST